MRACFVLFNVALIITHKCQSGMAAYHPSLMSFAYVFLMDPSLFVLVPGTM